jgi:hypothetical protein
VRLDRAAGRLVELRELQRGLQAEAARALLACDRGRREIGLLGAAGIVGIGLQEDVAADAVQERVGLTLASLLGERQRLIDPCQGHDVTWILGFEFGEPTLEKRLK